MMADVQWPATIWLVIDVRRVSVLAALVAAVALTGCGQSTEPHPTATGQATSAAPATAARRHQALHARAAAKPKRTGSARVDVLTTPFEAGSRCVKPLPAKPEHVLTHRQWLSGVTITEYYPAPERWFTGRKVSAPGLPGLHAVDWLYSARGLAMEGNGVDLHGRPVHIAALGSTGWVNLSGENTVPVCLGKWSQGFPVWLIGGWRNRHGAVTFPRAGGGWANGAGGGELPYGGVTFASGEAQPLRYLRSIAVDPDLIPDGSRVFIPAYRHLTGGWFVAQDTGGAIRGRHIDVYRAPPASPNDLGRYLTGQRVLVLPPIG